MDNEVSKTGRALNAFLAVSLAAQIMFAIIEFVKSAKVYDDEKITCIVIGIGLIISAIFTIVAMSFLSSLTETITNLLNKSKASEDTIYELKNEITKIKNKNN